MIRKVSETGVRWPACNALAGRVRNVCHAIIDRALAPVFAWADARMMEDLL